MEAADSSERLANVFHFTFTAVRASKVRPCSAPNKTAKVPRCHAAHRNYAGIFYVRNVTQFHGTIVNANLMTSMRKVRPSLRADFQETHKFSTT